MLTHTAIGRVTSNIVRADSLLARYATPLTVTLSLVVGVSGMLLFFHLFKNRVQSMHEWLGVAFLLAVALHAVRHRRPFTALFAGTRTHFLLAVAAVVSASFLILSPADKPNPGKSATQALLRAPITTLAPVLGLSPAETLTRLGAAAGSAASAEQSIEALARLSHVDPIKLLMAVMVEEKKH